MKNLIVFLISITISIFFCEFLLRYVIVDETLKLRVEANQKQFKDFQKLTWNPNLLSFEPNSIGEVNHPEYNYKIKHDKLGFRNPCILKNKYNLNNIILGDSFVYGVGVKDLETLSCLVNVNNYTIGVPNTSPNCYFQLFRDHYPKIKTAFNINGNVKLHFIIYVGNDFEDLVNLSNACPTEKINKINFNHTKPLSYINYIITKGFLSEFYLPQLPKILYKNYLNKKKYLKINLMSDKYFLDNGNDTFYTKQSHVNQKKLTESLNILNNELKKIDKNNLDILFYLLPSGSDISEQRLIRKSKISGFDYKIIDTDIKYSSILKSCSEIKVICKDLRSFFVDKNFYYHDTHLNSEGVTILSKIISINGNNFN